MTTALEAARAFMNAHADTIVHSGWAPVARDLAAVMQSYADEVAREAMRKEREACATVAKDALEMMLPKLTYSWNGACHTIAAAIRSRGDG